MQQLTDSFANQVPVGYLIKLSPSKSLRNESDVRKYLASHHLPEAVRDSYNESYKVIAGSEISTSRPPP